MSAQAMNDDKESIQLPVYMWDDTIRWYKWHACCQSKQQVDWNTRVIYTLQVFFKINRSILNAFHVASNPFIAPVCHNLCALTTHIHMVCHFYFSFLFIFVGFSLWLMVQLLIRYRNIWLEKMWLSARRCYDSKCCMKKQKKKQKTQKTNANKKREKRLIT